MNSSRAEYIAPRLARLNACRVCSSAIRETAINSPDRGGAAAARTGGSERSADSSGRRARCPAPAATIAGAGWPATAAGLVGAGTCGATGGATAMGVRGTAGGRFADGPPCSGSRRGRTTGWLALVPAPGIAGGPLAGWPPRPASAAGSGLVTRRATPVALLGSSGLECETIGACRGSSLAGSGARLAAVLPGCSATWAGGAAVVDGRGAGEDAVRRPPGTIAAVESSRLPASAIPADGARGSSRSTVGAMVGAAGSAGGVETVSVSVVCSPAATPAEAAAGTGGCAETTACRGAVFAAAGGSVDCAGSAEPVDISIRATRPSAGAIDSTLLMVSAPVVGSALSPAG